MRLASALVAVFCLLSRGDASPESIRAVGARSVRALNDFWAPRLLTNHVVTIPHVFRMNEETGRIDNLRIAAGRLVALERGPLVYCVEGGDHGGSIEKLRLSNATPLSAAHHRDLLNGVTVIRGGGTANRTLRIPPTRPH